MASVDDPFSNFELPEPTFLDELPIPKLQLKQSVTSEENLIHPSTLPSNKNKTVKKPKKHNPNNNTPSTPPPPPPPIPPIPPPDEPFFPALSINTTQTPSENEIEGQQNNSKNPAKKKNQQDLNEFKKQILEQKENENKENEKNMLSFENMAKFNKDEGFYSRRNDSIYSDASMLSGMSTVEGPANEIKNMIHLKESNADLFNIKLPKQPKIKSKYKDTPGNNVDVNENEEEEGVETQQETKMNDENEEENVPPPPVPPVFNIHQKNNLSTVSSIVPPPPLPPNQIHHFNEDVYIEPDNIISEILGAHKLKDIL